ncbi:Uncharacterised protein [Candidatus Ornithobacterium hominis]|uniref:hypothetical protein n=1 Tax=Candidatus Ornithobacterium hominis TaxID=2497989 RepID=UPI000E822BFD|nr:hypothetical protein [Candidatus Ornithobacterium hominis]SZD72738.1 Uncharacterised protein [Candidatus Ornithobacterium hominis]
MTRFLVLFSLCVVFISCAAKKVKVQQEEYQAQQIKLQKLDSIVQTQMELNQAFNQKSFFENSKFELRSLSDSIPLTYTHELNGKTVEKITLSGGVLLRSKGTNNQSVNQTFQEKKDEKSKVFIESESIDRQQVKKKEKTKEVKGIQFNFWIYFFGFLLAAMAYLTWRLKLF